MKLLTFSGDNSVARGLKGPHHYMLQRFSQYWDRIDILVPWHPEAKDCVIEGHVHLHVAPPSHWARWRWLCHQATKLIHQHRHNLMAAHDYVPFHHGRAAHRVSQRTGVPVVSELYHVEGYPVAVDLNERIRRYLTARYYRSCWKRFRAIRVINQTQIPNWLKALKVPDEKICLLYSSYTDLETFQPRDVKKDVDVLFVGRLVRNKGLDELMLALTKLPGVSARLIGVGPLEETLKKRIVQSGMSDRVQLHGWAKDNLEIADHINRARCLVCCSRSEGGPRTTLEAMACAVPVISTKVGTMPDMIEHRQNGCLVDFSATSLKEEIRWLLDQPEDTRQQMGEAGRQTVMPFERDKLIRELAQGYQSLVS